MPRGEGRRIAHTKSRLGCQRCKARKVKCDEVHPRCSNCIKYDTPCQYPSGFSEAASLLSPPPARSEKSSRRSTTPSSTGALSPDHGVQSRSRGRLSELQLMHHYSTVTCQQDFMANYDPGIRDLYTRIAPTLALKHESLMNAILAVAALHIYKLNPDKTEFRDLNRKYFNAAVIVQREAVGKINPENSDALCLAATFIAIQALPMQQESTEYLPPSVWLDLTTGHRTLYDSAWNWLIESNQILAITTAEPVLRDFQQKCHEDYPENFPDNLHTIFAALLDFHDPSDKLDEDQISAYKWCMAYIGHSLEWIEGKKEPAKIRRLLSAYGAMSPPIYKTQVRERRPRALVVLAHYFAILKAVDSVWWLRGVPEREIFGIQGILPERWQWAMAWPMQKLSFYAAAAIPSQEIVNTLES